MHPGSRGEHIEEHGPVYKAIERVLWALAPALILFLALTYPSMKVARENAAAQMDVAIAAENAEYCIKWGMPDGSPEYLACLHDLVAIRGRSEQRVRDEAVSDF